MEVPKECPKCFTKFAHNREDFTNDVSILSGTFILKCSIDRIGMSYNWNTGTFQIYNNSNNILFSPSKKIYKYQVEHSVTEDATFDVYVTDINVSSSGVTCKLYSSRMLQEKYGVSMSLIEKLRKKITVEDSNGPIKMKYNVYRMFKTGATQRHLSINIIEEYLDMKELLDVYESEKI